MNQIITFYSYKGGVGRSMALANIAVLLARWGYKTLIVDWDLEAPGLENFFSEYINIQRSYQHNGLINVFESYKENKTITWQSTIQHINIPNTKSNIHFISAGKREHEYFSKVRKFDIGNFYEHYKGGNFIENLRTEWKAEYDFVLVDSRTGITDLGGICTIQLPDILVTLFTATEQGFKGVLEVTERAMQAHEKLPFDRQKLIVLPVASRLDSQTEFQTTQKWIRRFAEDLDIIYESWLPKNLSKIELIEITKIPHIAYFSYGEKLPVIEQDVTDPAGLGYVYETLSALLVNNLQKINILLNNRVEYVNSAIFKKDINNLLMPESRVSFQSQRIIKVIGVGGAGINAVTHMHNTGIHEVDFVICNTDIQILNESSVPDKLVLGFELTRGLGAGSDPKIGQKAAEEVEAHIQKILQPPVQMLFVVAGMGGGTGTGAAPVIARIAKELDILTVAIVTEPFDFEGIEKHAHAKKGIYELKKYCDAVMVVKLDNLVEMFDDLVVDEAFAKADDILAMAVRSVTDLITKPGKMNRDFLDVKMILKNAGHAIIGFGEAEGTERASIAIQKALNSPLLGNFDINEAQRILISVAFSDERSEYKAKMSEQATITKFVEEQIRAPIIFFNGYTIDRTLGPKLRVSIIVAGGTETTKNNFLSQKQVLREEVMNV